MIINNINHKKLLEIINKKSFFDKGFAPWYKWESENSSFGKCLRFYSNYPKILPLMANSDHAVHSESKLWKNELSTDKKIPYFTWNYSKFLKFKKIKTNVYYIHNPCSYYINKKLKKKKKKRNGTLIFYPHSNLLSAPIINNDKYFESLNSLHPKYKPLHIMVSFHDILNKKYIDLLKYNMPILTAGNTSSKNFIDKFYKILNNYKYATSPISSHSIGSSFFYSIDIGVKYFFFNRTKFKIIKSNQNFKKKILKDNDYLDLNDKKKINHLHNLFSLEKLKYNNYTPAKISQFMGYKSKITQKRLLLILLKALILNFDKVILLYLKTLKKVLNF